MKIKSLLLVAPLVLSAGFLASCNGTQAEAAEWSKIKAGVDCYDETAADNRVDSLTINGHVNSFNVNGTDVYVYMDEKEILNKNNISIKLGQQNIADLNIGYDLLQRIAELAGSKAIGKIQSIFPELVRLPVNDYVMLMLDGYDKIDPTGGEIYTNYKSSKWTKLSCKYVFVDNKLSKIEFDMPSLTEFNKEYKTRLNRTIMEIPNGDASIKGSINIDVNTGFATSLNLICKSTDNIQIEDKEGKDLFKFTGNFDFDVTLNVNRTVAKKFSLQYQIKEFTPVIHYYDSETKKGIYRFDLTKRSKVYSSISDLKKDYNIDFKWIKLTGNYDDEKRGKDIYLTEKTEKNTVYSGFDYAVSFESDDYGFILNSDTNKDTMPETITLLNEEEESIECVPYNNITYSLSYGSSVKCSTVELTTDKAYVYEKGSSNVSVGFNVDNYGFTSKSNGGIFVMNGSTLDNDNGTYTVSLGVYKIAK